MKLSYELLVFEVSVLCLISRISAEMMVQDLNLLQRHFYVGSHPVDAIVVYERPFILMYAVRTLQFLYFCKLHKVTGCAVQQLNQCLTSE